MNSTVEKIKKWIVEKNNLEEYTVKGIWGIKCLFQPSKYERVFNYNIILIQTSGQGVCYYEGKELSKKELGFFIGKLYDFSNNINKNIEIAILDSIVDSFNIPPSYQYILQGRNDEKSIQRAEIILKEVNLISKQLSGNPIKVCNIGVVTTLIKLLIENNYDVYASDKDKQIVGKKLFDKIEVKSHHLTISLIKNVDIAIISGMVLATNTFENIYKVAKKYNTKIILFAETGAAFAPFYIDYNYADVVVSESFPFYTFNGRSEIKIYKNEI